MKFLVVVGFCAVLYLASGVSHGTPLSSSKQTPKIRGRESLFKEPPPPPPASFGVNGRAAELLTITQKVDQFNATNTDTYQMRYYANGDHYVAGGPLFIYIGGEWSISAGWVQGGHMYDMAREMGGYVFYTEHRYYGASFPTPDASTENLRYLDVDQALADLAYFIEYQRRTIPGAQNSGVIVVGASYSATMAAWFRQQYPHLANGAWASSAPLLAQLDFPEYMQVVSWAMGHVGGDACKTKIHQGFAQIEAALAARNNDLLEETFNLCQDILMDDELDVANFVSSVAYEFAGLVQYHWTGDIEGVCEVLTDDSHADALAALGYWVRSMYGSYCMDARYQSFVDYYSNPSWSAGSTTSAGRQWYYQTCNEYGWYQTAADGTTVFGNKMSLQLSVQGCADLYSNHFTKPLIQYGIDKTNRNHHGMTPLNTNTIYTHGSIDPWRPMGVQTDVNADSPVVILEGYSHCADLYSISASDSQQMRETKERVTSLVRQWLGL